jgi:hypothetical protein
MGWACSRRGETNKCRLLVKKPVGKRNAERAVAYDINTDSFREWSISGLSPVTRFYIMSNLRIPLTE